MLVSRPGSPQLYLLLLSLCIGQAVCARSSYTPEFGNDFDLTSFVTVSMFLSVSRKSYSDEHFQRPEIKAPVFNVEVFDQEALDEGYWFIGPYAWILQSQTPPHKNIYQPCQTGPHIYDQDGVRRRSKVAALEASS